MPIFVGVSGKILFIHTTRPSFPVQPRLAYIYGSEMRCSASGIQLQSFRAF